MPKILKTRFVSGLYGVTQDGSSNLYQQVKQALQGGAQVIQYRDKQSDSDQRLQDAQRLKSLCDEYAAIFIVNDDIDLALQVDADGVHVGKDDGDIVAIKQRLGDKILGVSCYNSLTLAQKAEQLGADYVAFGRFFVSQTKPDAIQAEPNLIVEAKSRLRVPVVAIGGIKLNNAKQLIDAGVDAIAVVDGLFGEENIVKTAKEFSNLFINA